MARPARQRFLELLQGGADVDVVETERSVKGDGEEPEPEPTGHGKVRERGRLRLTVRQFRNPIPAPEAVKLVAGYQLWSDALDPGVARDTDLPSGVIPVTTRRTSMAIPSPPLESRTCARSAAMSVPGPSRFPAQRKVPMPPSIISVRPVMKVFVARNAMPWPISVSGSP